MKASQKHLLTAYDKRSRATLKISGDGVGVAFAYNIQRSGQYSRYV
jgi:hypothetical protein